MNIQDALLKGKQRLAASCASASISTPELDASLLLSAALSKNREELIVHGCEAIADADLEKFFDLLERRRAGECVAYILGYKEFRGLNFAVNPHVLVPRPDTETLLEAALEQIDGMVKHGLGSLSLLDLCTGSGALAISLKNERPLLKITASDISKEALKTARYNAERLIDHISSRKDAKTQRYSKSIRFLQGNLFKNIESRFDIIVSNPPYIPSAEVSRLPPEVRREPKLALDGGADGLVLIREIISRAQDHLQPGGVLLLEASPDQMPAIKTYLENLEFYGIKLYKDLSGRERVISANKP